VSFTLDDVPRFKRSQVNEDGSTTFFFDGQEPLTCPQKHGAELSLITLKYECQPPFKPSP